MVVIRCNDARLQLKEYQPVVGYVFGVDYIVDLYQMDTLR